MRPAISGLKSFLTWSSVTGVSSTTSCRSPVFAAKLYLLWLVHPFCAVVQKSCDDGLGVHAELHEDTRDSQRVRNIRRSGKAALIVVLRLGERVRLLDQGKVVIALRRADRLKQILVCLERFLGRTRIKQFLQMRAL